MIDSSEKIITDRDWSAYYQAVAGRPPRGTLLKALDLFEIEKSTKSPRFAVDLGCGDGRDTVELLERGWQVLAIDGNEEAIAKLCDRQDIDSTRLETQVMRFESLTLPNSIFLPFALRVPNYNYMTKLKNQTLLHLGRRQSLQPKLVPETILQIASQI